MALVGLVKGGESVFDFGVVLPPHPRTLLLRPVADTRLRLRRDLVVVNIIGGGSCERSIQFEAIFEVFFVGFFMGIVFEDGERLLLHTCQARRPGCNPILFSYFARSCSGTAPVRQIGFVLWFGARGFVGEGCSGGSGTGMPVVIILKLTSLRLQAHRMVRGSRNVDGQGDLCVLVLGVDLRFQERFLARRPLAPDTIGSRLPPRHLPQESQASLGKYLLHLIVLEVTLVEFDASEAPFLSVLLTVIFKRKIKIAHFVPLVISGIERGDPVPPFGSLLLTWALHPGEHVEFVVWRGQLGGTLLLLDVAVGLGVVAYFFGDWGVLVVEIEHALARLLDGVLALLDQVVLDFLAEVFGGLG